MCLLVQKGKIWKYCNNKKNQNGATPKIQYQKETLSRFDPSNTQSVPCGTRKWAHRDVSMDWRNWARAPNHVSRQHLHEASVCLCVCGGGAHVCNWSRSVSHMPLSLWCQTRVHTHTHMHILGADTHAHKHVEASLKKKKKPLHFIRKVNTSAVWSG